MFNTGFLLPLAAVLIGFLPIAKAQEVTEQRKVRIEIITNENGETKRVTHEFDATSEEEMEKALHDLGVMDHLSLGADGEDVEIDIRRSFPGMDPLSWRDAGGGPSHSASGRTTYLGVSTQNLNDDLIKEHGLKVKDGAFISEVTSGSAAEKVGLKAGDVIVELDGTPVRGPEELTQAVRAKVPGDNVEIAWSRKGKRMNGTVELGERRIEQRRFEFHAPSEKEEGWNNDEPGTNEGSVAFLGVMPGTDSEYGVRIGRVEEGSAAERMGLAVNDVILEVDGKPVGSFEELSAVIRSHEPKQTVDLLVQRDGEQLSLSGELGERQPMRWAMPYGGRMDDSEAPMGFDHEQLQQEMERLRKDMDQLQRDLGRDRSSSTRILIERRELSPEEKELLRTKGVEDLDRELELGGLQTFPNPSAGFYRLQFDVAEKGDLGVEVFDSAGERIYQERITAFKGRYERTLDLSDRASGSYFLVITQNGKSSTQKLIKE